MPPAAPEDVRVDRATALAYVAVVLYGVVLVSSPGYADFSIPRLAFLYGGSAGLVLVGTSRRAQKRFGFARHLAAQVLITVLLVWTSRGLMMLSMLPLVSQAALIGRRSALAAAAIAVAFVGVVFAHFYGAGSVPRGVVGFASAATFVIAFTEVAAAERATRAKLARYADQAEELATVRERNRLARELHDSLGHYLTAVHVRLQAAETLLDRDPVRAAEAVSIARRLTHEGLEDVRRSVSALRTPPEEQRPLPDVIRALLDDLAVSGVRADLAVTGTPGPLAPRVELTLFRAAQEALTNVRKHAQARRVEVRLAYAADGAVRLTVRDDGRGSTGKPDGFGLLGLRERVALLGGSLGVRTEPGAGFLVEVVLPPSPL